ncbi:uncharacterized protein LOC134775543 [Penaeus indicus]|uniref:uncharacterized protein LOC134775543 n=1 Tax=Penaeus indicus TaxID=29960 RepID=UPI00300C206C
MFGFLRANFSPTITPKKTQKKTGKKTPKKVEPEEPKEEMEVEDMKEKVEGSKKTRRRKKRKRTVKAEDTETKENESPPKKTKTDLEVPSEKTQKKTAKKTPKEEEPEGLKEEKEVEDTKEKVEGGEKAKKKRKRKRKRKRSEKAEDAEAKKTNVPDEKLELEGELLDMHAKRKTDTCERTLVIKMKKFKQEYIKQRPDICKDALFYGIKFGKLCFAVYKSKAEAEDKLTELKKNPEVNYAWHWKQQQINATVNPYTLFVEHLPEGTTKEELQKMFPSATVIHYDANKLFVNLAFSTKEDAETIFRESENLKLKGVGIIVLFGKYGYNWEREPRKGTRKQLKPPTD